MYTQKPYSNKYKAIRQTYNGVNYDSKLEASRAYELDMLVKAKQIKGYERQYKIQLYYYDAKGRQYNTKTWKVDFRVENLDGTFTLEEVKGVELPDFKFKRELVENVWLVDNPDHSLVVLKQTNIRRRY